MPEFPLFAEGERVVCISSNNGAIGGKFYTIKKCYNRGRDVFVSVKELPEKSWFSWRFASNDSESVDSEEQKRIKKELRILLGDKTLTDHYRSAHELIERFANETDIHQILDLIEAAKELLEEIPEP